MVKSSISGKGGGCQGSQCHTKLIAHYNYSLRWSITCICPRLQKSITHVNVQVILVMHLTYSVDLISQFLILRLDYCKSHFIHMNIFFLMYNHEVATEHSMKTCTSTHFWLSCIKIVKKGLFLHVSSTAVTIFELQ